MPLGTGFWYENANGPVELAVNRASAVERHGLEPGERPRIVDPNEAKPG